MTEPSGTAWLLAAIALVVGATLGRFLNRCVDRFPRHESLRDQLTAPFRDTPAGRYLRKAQSWPHRLPIVGRLLPGNPLRRSRPAENVRLAAVELLNGVLFAALVLVEFPQGLTANPPDPFAAGDLPFLAPAGGSLTLQLVRFGLHLMLVQAMLVASMIDFERMIIPDGATLPVMLLAVVVGTLAGGIWLVPAWYEDTSLLAVLGMVEAPGAGVTVPAILREHPHLHGLVASLAGLVVGGGIVWAVRLIGHWALGREAMGFGDVILMAMIGSVIGWQPVLVVFFLAPLTAIIVILATTIAGATREFPFGPWLSLAAVLLLVFWQVIWPQVGRIFVMGRVLVIVAVVILVLLAVLLRGWRMLRGEEYWYDEQNGDWTSADQLTYLSGENSGVPRGSWRDRQDGEWPGIASGRGSLGEQRWKGTAPPDAIRFTDYDR